jgi:hypothetical protein
MMKKKIYQHKFKQVILMKSLAPLIIYFQIKLGLSQKILWNLENFQLVLMYMEEVTQWIWLHMKKELQMLIFLINNFGNNGQIRTLKIIKIY